MRNTLIVFCILILTASCSEYQQVLKSDDIGVKYAMADSLYEAGKYRKAIKLWEQIVPSYRGKPQAERVTYLYADTYYKVGDYYLAGYQFDRFVSAYPESEKAEEAQYKGAMSYAELSPRYSLDQSDTEKALDKLQQFIGRYPESPYTDAASVRIGELSRKIQRKELEIAKQYNKIGDAMSTYPSAIATLDDFLSDYPGSPFREEALFYKFDSQYKYAIGSLNVLVEERLQEAVAYYETLVRYFPNGEYRMQADEMKADIDQRLEQYL